MYRSEAGLVKIGVEGFDDSGEEAVVEVEGTVVGPCIG